MRFYTHTRLSEHMSETPEGFLICHGVPIARVGQMEYGAGETPIKLADGEARVIITREADEVFAPMAVSSFEGQPMTVNHPADDVTPANWKLLAVGHAQDIRRGVGAESDLLLADLVITDAQAIALVRGGLREVSCGYDADYVQTAPGRGRQVNIRGNHIALVHRGRCGTRCRINDNREDAMPTKKRTIDKFLDWFKSPEGAKVLDALEAEEQTPQPPEQQPDPKAPAADAPDELTALKTQLNELQIMVRQLMEKATPTDDEEQPAEPDVPADGPAPEKPKPEQPKPERKTGDSRTVDVRTVDAETKARARILVPGLPVRDSDLMCAVQRTALATASARDAGVASVVTGALRGSTLDSCDCMTLDAAFLAASEVARAANNGKTADALTTASVKDFGKTVTAADVNQMNAEFYTKGGA